MAYSAPLGNAVDFIAGQAPYTAPSGSAVNFLDYPLSDQYYVAFGDGRIGVYGEATGFIVVRGYGEYKFSLSGEGVGVVTLFGMGVGSLNLTGDGFGSFPALGFGEGMLELTGAASCKLTVFSSGEGTKLLYGEAFGSANNFDFTGKGLGTFKLSGVSFIGRYAGIGSGFVHLSGTALSAHGISPIVGAGSCSLAGVASGAAGNSGLGFGKIQLGGQGVGARGVTLHADNSISLQGLAVLIFTANDSGTGEGTIVLTGGAYSALPELSVSTHYMIVTTRQEAVSVVQ